MQRQFAIGLVLVLGLSSPVQAGNARAVCYALIAGAALHAGLVAAHPDPEVVRVNAYIPPVDKSVSKANAVAFLGRAAPEGFKIVGEPQAAVYALGGGIHLEYSPSPRTYLQRFFFLKPPEQQLSLTRVEVSHTYLGFIEFETTVGERHLRWYLLAPLGSGEFQPTRVYPSTRQSKIVPHTGPCNAAAAAKIVSANEDVRAFFQAISETGGTADEPDAVPLAVGEGRKSFFVSITPGHKGENPDSLVVAEAPALVVQFDKSGKSAKVLYFNLSDKDPNAREPAQVIYY
ncbi:hypothetical protein K2X33_08455 [bacterium]|nr:hypothetical protein [bacterium]